MTSLDQCVVCVYVCVCMCVRELCLIGWFINYTLTVTRKVEYSIKCKLAGSSITGECVITMLPAMDAGLTETWSLLQGGGGGSFSRLRKRLKETHSEW